MRQNTSGMMQFRLGFAVTAMVATAGIVSASDTGVQDRHSVYVGVRVCAECHSGPESDHPFSRWRASKHARAYASLWSPQAKRIAELSGIPDEPQRWHQIERPVVEDMVLWERNRVVRECLRQEAGCVAVPVRGDSHLFPCCVWLQ